MTLNWVIRYERIISELQDPVGLMGFIVDKTKCSLPYFESVNGCTIWLQFVILTSLITDKLKTIRNNFPGHLFTVKTLAKLRDQYYWLSCQIDLIDWGHRNLLIRKNTTLDIPMWTNSYGYCRTLYRNRHRPPVCFGNIGDYFTRLI